MAPNEIRTEFESSVLSLAVAEAADSDSSSRILVGLNSGEVQEWDMGHGGDARAIRSRDGVIGNLYDSDPDY